QIPITKSSSPQNTQTPRQALQDDTQLPQTSVPIPNVAGEAVFKEWNDRVVRATTTAASLDAAHDSGNITKTQSTAISNDTLSQEIGSGVNTPESDEERLEQHELTDNVSPTPHDSHISQEGSCPGNTKDCSKTWSTIKLQRKFKRIGKGTRGQELQDNSSLKIGYRPEIDEELAQRLFEEEQVHFEREQRIARERAAEQEAKDAALIEQMEDVQARMDADELLAARLQEQEREQFSIDEHARFLVETIAARKKFFAAQRAAEIRNRPPTRTQLRNQMITYLKHMGKYTHNQLKSKSFEEIQKLYKKEQQWINDFVPMSDDSRKKDDSSSKQAESSKKRQERKHG
ncbi:hypothetical protein Tco_1020830, partial [Tanacetum coccineum]